MLQYAAIAMLMLGLYGLLTQRNVIKIIAVEAKNKITLNIPELGFPITIKGTVDRVDEFNGTTRIIDYKTGKVEAGQLKMSDFSLLSNDYKYTKAMQVMLYSYLYVSKTNSPISQLQSGVISFKNLN